MKYTAKQWRLTIWFIDALFVGLLLFVAWLTWDLYRLSGSVRSLLHPYHLLSLAVFFGIRSLAKKEKKKAELAEATPAKP
jgi:uncharacterized membrane protein YqjE